MYSGQTGRQSAGIVGNYEIVSVQKIHERTARHVNQVSLFIDDEQLRINRTLNR
jgi:hypothetical protein